MLAIQKYNNPEIQKFGKLTSQLPRKYGKGLQFHAKQFSPNMNVGVFLQNLDKKRKRLTLARA
jgi:hypothetical protein